jgi:hypothetical protein
VCVPGEKLDTRKAMQRQTSVSQLRPESRLATMDSVPTMGLAHAGGGEAL